MIKNRDLLLKILNQEVENKNIIKHMLATEACMMALAKHFKADNQDEWAMAGLMHDGDYKDSVPVEKQGIQITNILKKEGIPVSDSVAQAMAAHNWRNTGVEPQTKMDCALFCCDSLTGLIVATALVMPSKKLEDVNAQRVLNRFKENSFARGTRREDIAMCEEKLGIKLEDFVNICLNAMKEIAGDLGL